MSLDPLRASAGRWRGTSRLMDPAYGIAEECSSIMTVTVILGGRFVRLDYTWSYRDEPQEGSLLVGLDPNTSRLSAHWIDTWHNGHAVMACEGTAGDDRRLCVRGSYAAPPGPDWGWRVDVVPAADGELRIEMFNVSPEGDQELAVDGVYSPD